MGWVKLDDAFGHHPKIVRAGPLATLLWVHGLAYCNRYKTDGRIPMEALPTLLSFVTEAHRDTFPTCLNLATRLLEAKLWLLDEDGETYIVHDYAKYQPTRVLLEAKRDAVSAIRSESGRKGGLSRARGLLEQAEANAVANAKQNCSPVPVPVPVPNVQSMSADALTEDETTRVRKLTKPRARTALSDSWEPPADEHAHSWHQEARKHGLTVAEVSQALAEFKLHYAANGELRADWVASWRLWLSRVRRYGSVAKLERGCGAKQQAALPGEHDWSVAARAKAKVV